MTKNKYVSGEDFITALTFVPAKLIRQTYMQINFIIKILPNLFFGNCAGFVTAIAFPMAPQLNIILNLFRKK